MFIYMTPVTMVGIMWLTAWVAQGQLVPLPKTTKESVVTIQGPEVIVQQYVFM